MAGILQTGAVVLQAGVVWMSFEVCIDSSTGGTLKCSCREGTAVARKDSVTVASNARSPAFD